LGKLDLVNADLEELHVVAEKMDIDILHISAHDAASFHKLPKLEPPTLSMSMHT